MSCRSAGPSDLLFDLRWLLASVSYLLQAGWLVDKSIGWSISPSIGRLIGWPIGVLWPLVRWRLLAVGSSNVILLFGVSWLLVGLLVGCWFVLCLWCCSVVTFSLGVKPVWSVVGSVGLQFLWLDEDDGSFSWDSWIARYSKMAQWYDAMVRWDGTTVWWHNMPQWRNGTMTQCTMAQLHNALVFS